MNGSLKIVVVDYESGNLRSVSKALETTGVNPIITGDPDLLRDADAVILPGVGSGPAAMDALNSRGFAGPLREYVASGRPFSASASDSNSSWTTPKRATHPVWGSSREP